MNLKPLLFLWPLLAAASLSAAPDFTARASYLWTENIGRASGRADFRDAAQYEAAFTAGLSRQLSSSILGRAQLELTGIHSPDFDALDELNFGPRGILRKKFGLGPDAPVLAFEAATIGRLARIDENNGLNLQGAVTLSKRFGPFFSARVRGEWEEHVANSNTYDTRHYGAHAAVSFDPIDRLRLSAGVGRISGLFTAGASGARFTNAQAGALGPAVADYYNAIPVSINNSLEPDWTVYRVEGDIDLWWFEISPALTDTLSLTVRYERTHAINIVDVEYRQDIFTVSLVYSF